MIKRTRSISKHLKMKGQMETPKRVVYEKGNWSSRLRHHGLPLRCTGGDHLGRSLRVPLVSGLHRDMRSWH